MKNRITLSCTVILSVSMLALWGCPKSTQVSSSPEAQNVSPSAPRTASRATAGPEAGQEGKEGKNERTASGAQGLEPIHFDYNQSVIRADAAAVMKADAQWLKAHPGVKIRIEGNCDERGTKEYNLALGERRATSAMKYLANMGISSTRISLISYGKEKPACTEENEACWQKNRRDDFVSQ